MKVERPTRGALWWQQWEWRSPRSGVPSVYCDGGFAGKPRVGAWAWRLVDSGKGVLREASGVLAPPEVASCIGPLAEPWEPDIPLTNEHVEVEAILRALDALPLGWEGNVYSDSQNALVRVFLGCLSPKVGTRRLLCLARAKKRIGLVRPIWLRGHPNQSALEAGISARRGIISPSSMHHVWCDQECSRLLIEAKTAFRLRAQLASPVLS